MRLSYEHQIFLIVEATEVAEVVEEFPHQLIDNDWFNVNEVILLQFAAFGDGHGQLNGG